MYHGRSRQASVDGPGPPQHRKLPAGKKSPPEADPPDYDLLPPAATMRIKMPVSL